jgi:hypothetical protein
MVGVATGYPGSQNQDSQDSRMLRISGQSRVILESVRIRIHKIQGCSGWLGSPRAILEILKSRKS